ncbi:MAG: twin-arginine translocation signal domain-containing protein, partial [Burkholderiaceae bacterium]
MTSKTAQDFDPEVMKLFDQYVHGQLNRRDFLQASTKFAVGAVTAEVLLETLSPRFAEAQQVQAADPR